MFSAMPWQAEQEVVVMTDGSSISLACGWNTSGT